MNFISIRPMHSGVARGQMPPTRIFLYLFGFLCISYITILDINKHVLLFGICLCSLQRVYYSKQWVMVHPFITFLKNLSNLQSIQKAFGKFMEAASRKFWGDPNRQKSKQTEI